MATHNLAEAQERLPDLIERALAGEEVVIAGEGERLVALTPVSPRSRAIEPTDLEWLRRHRVGQVNPTMNAAQLIRAMRDEGY